MELDPEFVAYVAAQPAPSPPTNTNSQQESKAEASRQRLEWAVGGYLAKFSSVIELVKETVHTFKSYDGFEIAIHEFARKDLPETTAPSPAILYLHGGGNISCPVDKFCRFSIAQFAIDFSIRTFGVEFRLAPENPYPTPLEDCYAALKWVMENATALSIDSEHIGLFGESGGGGLVAGVSLLARDRTLSPPIAKQMMVYPMLDDRSSTRHFNKDSPRDQSLKGFIDLIDVCWSAYLGIPEGSTENPETREVPQYAAPARAEDLRGLPPTYIEVGGMDWFRNESLDFAMRLAKDDVDIEMHLYRGVPHCYDMMAPDIPVSRSARDSRRRAIRGV